MGGGQYGPGPFNIPVESTSTSLKVLASIYASLFLSEEGAAKAPTANTVKRISLLAVLMFVFVLFY